MVVCPSCGEENPDRFRLCGFCGTSLAPAAPQRDERRTVTIVFSDLQGSTNLGEALDTESVRGVMMRYFDAMTPVLRRHGGTIEKFIGDAIMAVFGLPRIHEDDALRAVRAARETQAALATLNDELERDFGVRLTNRTGVNTGEVVTGDAAGEQRIVIGDTVNTAARLEQAAGPNEVLIGQLTWRLVRDAVEVEAVEPLDLKGKAEPVPAYRLIDVAPDAEGAARDGRQPLVGRAEELITLMTRYRTAVDERRTMIATVIGDAGVGKSRLIREAVASVSDEATVVGGRCLSYGEGITFWPVIEAVRNAARVGPDDSAEIGMAKLTELVADAAVVARLASVIGLSEETFSVDELFWAVRRWLETMSERTGPIVWVVDDIHWAEPTFLALLQHLEDEAIGHPIFVICSARHDLLDRAADWGQDGGRIMLAPLTDADAGEVVANLLGRSGIPGSITERVVTAAEGNPLFVEQLISMLVDSGKLRAAEGGWEVVGGDPAEVSVPPTIHALLAARLDLLRREERSVIEPASVVGLEFSEASVAALVTETLVPAVPEHLGEIERKGLIEGGRTTALDEDGFRFHHILIRDAAYQNLLKRERSQLHERFVDWVDEVNRAHDRGAEFAEILGYHLEQAYRYLVDLGPLDDHGRELRDRAAERLGSAGRRALARGDMSAAAGLLRRASGLLDAGPLRAVLLVDLGEALTELGSFAEADEALTAAAVVASTAGDRRLEAKAELARLATTLYVGAAEDWGTRVDESVARSLPIFEADGDHDGLALAWRLRVGRHGIAAEFGESALAADEVVRHARLAGNRRYETRGASGYAQAALFGPTPVPDAIRRCTELLAQVESDRRTSAFIGGVLAELTAMDNRIDEGRALLAASVSQLAELGSNVLASSSSSESARIEILAGNLTGAEELLWKDHHALTAMGERYLLPSVDGLLARVLYTLDRFDEADELAVAVRNMAIDDDIDAQALWRSVHAMLLARRGEVDEAVVLSQEAIAFRRRSDALVWLADALTDFSEVLRFTGRDDEVRAVRNEALRLYERKGDVVSAGRLRALLA
ncbi:MAG TPA: adenylate/guanylate cyclase domain-containing protein [Candidatus Limnocylindria bacterium]|nr:adenylate/guanylate cyclase domain-containing protein [Candidatus Limnocylindria bacterium]